MTGRRVPWWVWVLVAVPWAAGLVCAAAIVAAGQADREVAVRAPAAVTAILAGSFLTLVAAAFVAGSRHVWTPVERDSESVAVGERGGSPHPLDRLAEEVAARLSNVRGLVDSLGAAAARGALTPDEDAALAAAQAGIDDLAALFTEVKRLTDLGKRAAEPVAIQLGPVLHDVVEMVTASPGLGGRHLTKPDLVTTAAALGDRDLLQMALHKIVVNAITSTRPGETIGIRVDDGGADIVVEVSDTGRGLSADEPQPVALTIARMAIERHGGAVRVRSRAGLGTVATVRLPAYRRGR